MKTKLQAMASRKLAFVGACVGWMIADASAHGTTSYHLLAVALAAAGYAVGQGLHDLGEHLGIKAKRIEGSPAKP